MKRVFFGLLIGLYLCIFFVTSYRLYARLGVFGCGDECINYTAAYFLKMGKPLYTQVFFNRQPLMAYASEMVQRFTHPTNIYSLVLYHRLSFVLYALVMGIFLVLRFGITGLLFLLLYEGTKFYVYGYQFIGEAVIVYPLVYMLGVVWESQMSKKLFAIDWYLVPLCAAIVFWTREPYVPVALGLVVSFLWFTRSTKKIWISIPLCILFFAVPYLWIPLPEYVRQVVTVNIPAVGKAFGIKEILYAIFYPVIIFFSGKQSYFRDIEIGIMVFVTIGIVFLVRQTKNILPLVVMFGLLSLAAIRSVQPGIMYFEAFHMLPWYALFCMMCAVFLDSISDNRIKNALILGFVLFTLWSFASPRAFIWEKVDRQAEFESQYAKYTHYSQAIQILTNPSQKIFLDIWDDIIYWESQRDSSYDYSLFIPVVANTSPYKESRIHMFTQNPPVVYYSCPNLATVYNSLPTNVRTDYIQLLTQGLPSCLYIHKTIMTTVTKNQEDALSRLEFSVPKLQ